jgi:hypothetical protein
MDKQYQAAYFAADGSFGDAMDITIVETTDWTEADWATIATANPSNRLYTVHTIMFKHVYDKQMKERDDVQN